MRWLFRNKAVELLNHHTNFFFCRVASRFEHFNTLFHQGQRESIQISLVGDRTLLAIVWDERTNLGLVRFYTQETSKRLEVVFAEIAARPPAADSGLADDYSKEAGAALDDLF